MPCPSVLRSAFLSGLLLLTACGGGGQGGEASPGGAQPAPNRADATPTQERGARDDDGAGRPDAPQRLFSSRFPPLGAWFDALRPKVSPAQSGWPLEVIATLARRELRRGVQEALGGSNAQGLTRLRDPEFTCTIPLGPGRPLERGAGGLRVRTGVLTAMEAGDPARTDPAAVFGDLVGSFRGAEDVDVELWVTGSWREAPLLHTRCFLRLSGTVDQEALQANVTFRAGWRLADGKVLLTSLTGEAYEELQRTGGGFQDLTRRALGAAAEPGRWLWGGALELADSTDNLINFTNVYLGMHGLAVGDLDGDGLEDVYVGTVGGTPNRLLRHQPDGSVVDVAGRAQVDFLDDTAGVLAVDLDGDGARDLVLALDEDIVIAWNDGRGVFGERTRLERGADDRDKVYSLAAADADGDGDLDLYDTRYFSGDYGAGGVPTPYHDARNGARNSLWRNDGDRRFAEATAEFGLDHQNDRFSLAALWEDVDGDGDLDLYVVNDFGRNNLYVRGDDGQYRDEAGKLGLSDMAAGMGITCADADADGVLDLYVTNMYTAAGGRVTNTQRFAELQGSAAKSYRRHTRGNTLLLGTAQGRFRDATEQSQSGPGGWAWGAMFADWDCDGFPDLYVPNGFLTGTDRRDLQSFFWREVVAASPPQAPATPAYLNAWAGISHLSQRTRYSWSGNERNYVYWNQGEGRFLDVTRASAGGVQDDTRVGATCDWDGDGRVDLWLRNRTAPVVRHLRNDLPPAGSWVAFELHAPAPNTEAIGALVEVEAGGRLHRKRVYAGEGYLGNPSKRLHFGLGPAERIDAVRVTWPDGGVTSLGSLEVRARYSLGRGGTAQPITEATRTAWVDPVHDPLETSEGQRWTRTVALERMPYGSFPLPRFGETAVGSVEDHAGRALLLYVWASWDEEAGERLRGLAARQAALRAQGLDLHPITLDGVRDEKYAQQLIESSGLEELGGRASLRERTLIELACQAIHAHYDDLQLPIGLLFDAEGRLSTLQVGEVDLDRTLADAQALATSPVGDAGTTQLTGGRWIDPPQRYYEKVIEVLRRDRGEIDIAGDLQAFVENR